MVMAHKNMPDKMRKTRSRRMSKVVLDGCILMASLKAHGSLGFDLTQIAVKDGAVNDGVLS